MTVATEPLAPQADKRRCPKCANTEGIRDGGPSFRGHRAYDILHDTFGLMRCPYCGFRAGAAEFQPKTHP